MIVYELDQTGYFVSAYPVVGDVPLENWTYDRIPNGLYEARYTGTRLETGEWVDGEWVDDIINLIGTVVYNTTTKEPLTIETIGPIPEGYTDQVPREFDYWDGSLWITDLVLRNTTLKARKMVEINQALENTLKSLRIDYPESEIMSWSKQENEARRWLVDNTSLTPMIDNIAEIRGIGKVDLINKIILKADQYTYAIGMSIGRRQYLEDRVLQVAIGNEPELSQYVF